MNKHFNGLNIGSTRISASYQESSWGLFEPQVDVSNLYTIRKHTQKCLTKKKSDVMFTIVKVEFLMTQCCKGFGTGHYTQK